MYENYLIHYGTIGMKWGQRRAGIKEKIGNIQKSGSAEGTTDVKRFDKLSQSPTKRVVGGFLKRLAVQAVLEGVSGSYKKYGSMDKKTATIEITKRVANMALKSGIKVASDDLLANHALRRYDAKGKRIPRKNGKAPTHFTSTDALEFSVKGAIAVAPLASMGIRFLVAKDVVTKRKEREKFEKWGANILPEKVNNIVWQSKDLETAVIDGPIILNKHKN